MEPFAKHTYTRSIERAADILIALGEQPDDMGVTELAKKLGLSKGTVYRLLQSLVRKGFVAYAADSRSYRLGGRVLQLGLKIQERLPLRSEVRPFLHQLRDLIGETATLYLRVGHQCFALEQVVTLDERKRIAPLGTPGRLVGAHGKVLLAFESEEFIDQYLATVRLEPFTPQTITDPEALKRELQAVQKQGYAMSIGEVRPRTSALAFPLLNAQRAILGAVSIAGPSDRWTAKAMESHIAAYQRIMDSACVALRYLQPITL